MIIIINNKKYDITEFLNEHPGGKNVFIDGADMTEEFNDVGHSKSAIKMLEKYYIGDVNKCLENINEKECKKEFNEEYQKEFNEENKKKLILNTTLVEILYIKFKESNISRLFTHEDKSNIHKILGTIILINSLYLFIDIAYSGCNGNITLRKVDNSYMILLWLHILLTITSFIFELPTNYNKIKPIMSKEYRLLVAIFTLRSLFISTILYFFDKNIYSHICCIAVTFLTTFLSDIINKYYKDHNDNLGAKINSYPFWLECPDFLKQFIIFSYSFGSIFFTTMCINSASTIPLHHYVIFALQFTAFLYTLSKKNIINTFQWHVLYLIEVYGALLLYYKFLFNNITTLPLVILFFIMRTQLNMSKYFIFILYSLMVLFYNFTDKTNSNISYFIILIILYFIYFYYNNLIFDKPRKSQYDVVLSNNSISKNINKIDIQLFSDNLNFYPGQYYNLYANEDKKPYTPISIDKNILSFLIKDYGNESISNKICKYYIENKAIVISGPFGNKYYDKEKDELKIDNKIIAKNDILMFCCGTGITPFYSILNNLNDTTKYNFNLFASFKSKKDTFLIDNLKIKHKLFLSCKNKLNSKKVIKIIKKKEQPIVLICGTSSYNQMIIDSIKDYNNKTENNIQIYVW
jgi:NAD(P)H-flavin reductase